MFLLTHSLDICRSAKIDFKTFLSFLPEELGCHTGVDMTIARQLFFYAMNAIPLGTCEKAESKKHVTKI